MFVSDLPGGRGRGGDKYEVPGSWKQSAEGRERCLLRRIAKRTTEASLIQRAQSRNTAVQLWQQSMPRICV